MRTILALGAALSTGLLLMAGCHSTPVYDVSASADNKGIPFYPLVPVRKEVLQYEQTWTRVDIAIESTDTIPGKTPTDPAIVKRAPISVSFYVGDGCTTKKGIPDLLAAGNDRAKILAVIADLASTCLGEPAAPLGADGAITNPKLPRIGSVRTIEMVPSRIPQYINVNTPYGGTASAEVQIDAEGRLTTSKADVKDTLPATITEQVGTVLNTAVTGLTAGLGAGLLAATSDNKNDPKEKADIVSETKVTYTLTQRRRIISQTFSWEPPGLGGAIDFSSCKPAPGTSPAPTGAAVCYEGITTVVEDVGAPKEGAKPAAAATAPATSPPKTP